MSAKKPEERSNLSDSLHKDRRFLESVFDKIPGMIYVHDLVSNMNLYGSRSLRQTLGLDKNQRLEDGRKIRSLAHPDDIPILRSADAKIRKAKDNECVSFVYRMRHQNGKWIWLRSEEYVYDRTEDGKPSKVLGYATDLTEQVQKSNELNKTIQLNELLLSLAQVLSAPKKRPTTVLRHLAKEISLHFDVVCDISIKDSKRNLVVPQAVYHSNAQVRRIIRGLFAQNEVKLDKSVVGNVITTGEEFLAQVVPEAMKGPPRRVDPKLEPVSIMYVPLRGSRSVLGSLNVTRIIGASELSDIEVNQLRRIGEYISLFIEKVLLIEQQQAVVKQKREAEKKLAEEKKWTEFKLEVSSILTGVDEELEPTLQRLCEKITTFFDVVSDLQLVDEEKGTVKLVAFHHYDKKVKSALRKTLKTPELKIGEGMVGGVVKTGKEFFIQKLPKELENRARNEGVDPIIIPCSFAYLPLISHGKILGTLDLTRLAHQNPISDQELIKMRDLASHAAQFIESHLLHVSQKKEIDLRKKAEQRLERNSMLLEKIEAETRAMLNTIPVYIARVSKDLRYIFLNNYYENLGRNPRKVEGRYVVDIIGDDAVKELKPRFDLVLSGEVVRYQWDRTMEDGIHHYFNMVLAPDYAENGEVVGFYSCAVDITEEVVAEKERKLTQDRFETLTLNSGDAFFFHDSKQRIIDVNQVAIDLLGYSREELLSMEAGDIDPRWNGVVYQKYLSKVEVNSPQTFDTEVVTKNGQAIPVEVRFVKRVEEGEVVIQSLMRDRTEKREQELRLQRSEQRLRLIFENVEDFIAIVGFDGHYETINKGIFGLPAEDIIGASIFEQIASPEQVIELRQKFNTLKKTGEQFEIEDSRVGFDGITRTYSKKFVGIFHGNTFFKCVLLIRDITAERNREKSLMNAVIRGQEQERKRLGAELHDGIGQILTAISFQVTQARRAVNQDEINSVKTELLSLQNNLSDAIKEVRNISHDLMPDVLESFGLVQAINQICSTLYDRSGVKVSFNQFDVNERYDQSIEVNLFRITQELLNNIQKHANCKNVYVNLMDYGESVSLTVEDDGVGFDPKKVKNGIGLRNIYSRLKMINGEIDIESSKNSGTLVNIEVPKTTK